MDGVFIPFNDTATHNGNVWEIYLLFKVHLIFGLALVTRPRRSTGNNEDQLRNRDVAEESRNKSHCC